MVRSAPNLPAKSAAADTLFTSSGTHSTSSAMPPLPGAHQIFSTDGLCLSFQTRACSRPPPPNYENFHSVRSIFIADEKQYGDAPAVSTAFGSPANLLARRKSGLILRTHTVPFAELELPGIVAGWRRLLTLDEFYLLLSE